MREPGIFEEVEDVLDLDSSVADNLTDEQIEEMLMTGIHDMTSAA